MSVGVRGTKATGRRGYAAAARRLTVPRSATSLADLLGVDFALINRNRKREANKRLRAAAADAAGRAPELWLIPAGGAPRSLGLVSIDRAHTVAVPDALRDALVNGSVLAITLEPATGAPQGIPTGPIIAKGDIANL